MCNSFRWRLKIKESYRIELLLKFLICIVDAELLKAVHLKCFKPVKKDKKCEFPNKLDKPEPRTSYAVILKFAALLPPIDIQDTDERVLFGWRL